MPRGSLEQAPGSEESFGAALARGVDKANERTRFVSPGGRVHREFSGDATKKKSLTGW
jgi:hypothetical protein